MISISLASPVLGSEFRQIQNDGFMRKNLLLAYGSPEVSAKGARRPIFPGILKASVEAFYEEKIDMVFARFIFSDGCRMVASPADRRD